MKKNPQSGYILIVVISVLSILMIIGLSFAGFSYYGLQRTAAVRDSTQAYYAARAGIANANQSIYNNGESQGKLESQIIPLGSSTTSSANILAEVSWEPATGSSTLANLDTGNSLKIISHGMVKIDNKIRGERVIQAVIDKSSYKVLYVTELPVTSMGNKEN